MLAELTEKKRITAPYKAAGGGGLAPWTPFPSVPSGADGTPKTILFQPQICPAHGEHLRLRCIAAAEAVTRAKEIADEAAHRCEFRRVEEAKQAVEILKQRAMLGKKEPKTN